MAAKWLKWQDVPAAFDAHDGGRLAEAIEQVWQHLSDLTNRESFAKALVQGAAAEFGAQSAALVERAPEWRMIAQHGRITTADLPGVFLAEVLDRDQSGTKSLSPGQGMMAAAPMASREQPTLILVLQGKTLPDDVLAGLSLMARAFGAAWDLAGTLTGHRRRIGELKAILEIAAELVTFPAVEPLLERIAVEATKLLRCDRASIFLWDRNHGELVARPALGVDGGSLRIPEHTGIVGEVIQTGRSIRVDDAYAEPRFSRKVDEASGYRTRNLLCVPMHGSERELIGVFEVINKLDGPFNAADEELLGELSAQVSVALQNTRERESLLRSHQQLTEQATQGGAIIGDSAAMTALRGTVKRLAETDLPVLVLGESGTGKEVVARALHYCGTRAERPFIAVNCAALAETLLESELFGHEKGAFTDAREMRRGKFEVAEGGTIFLDEIGDMSLGGQAKLLRVLEQKVITRVGGSQVIPINVRVVAATNAKLVEAVRAKKFREDLYFRLNVVTLDLPPLRDRPEDVLPLAEHFLHTFAIPARRPKLQLSPEAKRRLQAHAWPGNVRELRNLMERVAFLAPSDKIEASDLAFILSPERESYIEPNEHLGLSEATNRFQQDYIRRGIRRVRNNMSEAAKLLGLHRSNLYRKMRQLGMSEAGNEDDDIPDDESPT